MIRKILLTLSLILLAPNIFAQLTIENAFPNLTFSNTLFLTDAGDGSDRIFVVEQAGRIKVFPNNPSVTLSKIFLDITDRVSSGGEMGLLGLAFHPDYENNGFFYVNYTVSNPMMTRISRFRVSPINQDSANTSSELVLLTFDQPFTNHNGGWIGFGPNDGYLYIATGDGGSGGDPQDNAQDITKYLGKILRIDVDRQDPGLLYAIPSDNPFVDSTGSTVKEIYAWGLRNPWRDSFDPVTGWLWCADVGQNLWEEINIIENGKNYGWRCYEGNHTYNTTGCNYQEYTFPIWEYGHNLSCSITGGYVYRGLNVPELKGQYIYSDYCSSTLWSLEYDGINPPVNQSLLTVPASVYSFGTDQNNELYIVTPSTIFCFIPSVTQVENRNKPLDYKLEQNYPNPFNSTTKIKYTIRQDANNKTQDVTLIVYDMLGKEISTLVKGKKSSGSYEVEFDASDLPSGIYIYELKAGSYILSRKMILLR